MTFPSPESDPRYCATYETIRAFLPQPLAYCAHILYCNGRSNCPAKGILPMKELIEDIEQNAALADLERKNKGLPPVQG
jgi:hypothetical protein